MNLLTEAGAAQARASRPDKSSWVSANAGSGKTRVLTSRVARLLLRDVDPQLILCLTYTKAAAAVMQNRLFALLGNWSMLPTDELRKSLAELGESEETLGAENLQHARTLFAAALETPGGLKIQTIHSFCDSVLRKFPLEAGVSPSFSTLEAKQKRSILQDILREMARSDASNAYGAMASNMSNAVDGVGKLVEAIISERANFAVKHAESHFRKVLSLPAMADLRARLAGWDGPCDDESLQTMVFAVGKDHGFEPLRNWFKALYEVLLGASDGPRFGGFVALYGVAETVVLIDRALAGDLVAPT